ncbi:unnamed protein product, partial [Symbiodinium pilosum]
VLGPFVLVFLEAGHYLVQDWSRAQCTSSPDGSFHRVTAFPLRLGYSTTLHKIQGATLPHVTIWMDVPYVRAALYVALSRVQRDGEWRFIGSIDRRHCVPAKL